eukprot:CAMPEP_0202876564 /NCGR_PEP_ID=MMETSP1391-20130828/29207_1 /ASSEMBLY_ACC=CAM_ASM_000867 /TAXON_ID=1034604 /ORGANISM="Chlamydomonas leiostraca, Strain SAG 11-49" /LENGTH=62 /DNA_ID=CAMNT_0049558441 /DNA_START=20 /DNA_END=205 /DNA_ORIENTATION=-
MFLKPGSKSSQAFGISFDRPPQGTSRPGQQNAPPPQGVGSIARSEAERLPVARYKRELLYLV